MHIYPHVPAKNCKQKVPQKCQNLQKLSLCVCVIEQVWDNASEGLCFSSCRKQTKNTCFLFQKFKNVALKMRDTERGNYIWKRDEICYFMEDMDINYKHNKN